MSTYKTITLNPIEKGLLLFLYEEYFTKNDFTPLQDFEARNESIDKKLIEEAFLQLGREGLLEGRGMGPILEISESGILSLEAAGAAPEEIHSRQNEVRKKMLEALANDKKPGEFQDLRYESIVSQASISQIEFDANIEVLIFQGFVKTASVGGFAITRAGTEALKEWEQLGLDDLDVATSCRKPPRVKASSKKLNIRRSESIFLIT